MRIVFFFAPREPLEHSGLNVNVNYNVEVAGNVVSQPEFWIQIDTNTYLLLTSFFPLIYGPSAKRAGHKQREKTRIRNLQYGPRKRG